MPNIKCHSYHVNEQKTSHAAFVYLYLIANKWISRFSQKIVHNCLLLAYNCFVECTQTILERTHKPKLTSQAHNLSVQYREIFSMINHLIVRLSYLIYSIDINIVFQQSIHKVKLSRCSQCVQG